MRVPFGLDGSGVEQLARDLLGELLTTGTALLKLPQRVEQVLARLESGELRSKWIRNSEDRSAGSGAGLEATPVAVLQCLALPGPLCSRQHWQVGFSFSPLDISCLLPGLPCRALRSARMGERPRE